jgi:hypothetical protein
MALGLDPDKELIIRLGWLPRAPLRGDAALPTAAFRDEAAFRARPLDEALWDPYRFNFAQLAKQTPDLHFYRLVRLFNTPLVSMSPKDARSTQYALWGGRAPAGAEGQGYCHLWYFDDQADRALVALEYGYDGRFAVRSDCRSPDELQRLHAEIVSAIFEAH